jgi:serine/threonine-protein kinase HipA
MESPNEIQVSIMMGKDTLPAGKLWFHNRKGKQSASFEYCKEWLNNPDRFALEPALSLTEGAFHTVENQSLFGAIGDSAPDRWGRMLMQRANDTGRTLTELDYLLGVNDETRQGALRFSVEEGNYLAPGGKNAIPPLVKLPELLSLSEKFMEDKATAEELRMLLIPGSSLGGARPKASVLDKDGSLAIAKFPGKDDDTDIVRWEAAALTLAKKAGINVPDWRLEKILGKAVLIIKRFDRLTACSTNGQVKNGRERIPFLSAMSILEASDNDGQIHSYIDIANVLQQYGVRPDAAMKELWRRMVFGILISNTDDHLRNHGFLFTTGGWSLSPAYDLNPNTEKSMFATAIDNTGEQNTIELALRNTDAFNVSKAQAKEILDEVKTAVAGWQKTAKSLGLSSQDIQKMKPAFG